LLNSKVIKDEDKKTTGGAKLPQPVIHLLELGSLLLWWSGTLAFFCSFFSFTLNTGLLEKFAAAQFRKDTFLLHPLIEAPQ
jgi:hypothetical protein